MSRLTVRELPKAEADLGRILSYIAKRSPQGAADWLDAYDAAVEQISRNDWPRLFAKENDHVEEMLYQCFFRTRRGRTYRTIYIVDGSELLIVRVRGPGQQLLRASEMPFE